MTGGAGILPASRTAQRSATALRCQLAPKAGETPAFVVEASAAW
jgi:hypothetical protein